MRQPPKAARPVTKFGVYFIFGVGFAVFLSAGFAVSAQAQTAPAAAPIGPPPARQAIEVRKAVFALIANNFKPIGDTLQGKKPYDAADIQKRSARVAFLAELVGEAFPDVSNTGLPDTKAKPEIWSERADFDKRVKEFVEHSAALVQLSAKEQSASPAFKAAATAVAQDCKGCHDAYKVK